MATSRSVNSAPSAFLGPAAAAAGPAAPAGRRGAPRPARRAADRPYAAHRTTERRRRPGLAATACAIAPDMPITSTASTDRGETTIGPANSAWALIGTSSRASTSGQTIGPPGRERVRGGAGGGGADDAVARPPGQRAAVDLGHHLDHPLARDLLHACLVQRPGAGGDGAVLPHRHLDRHPLFHRVPVLHHLVDGAGQVVGLGLGEEPDVAQVDAEQRHARGPGHLRRPQQRAVAAEHDHHLGALGRGRRRGHHIGAGAAQIGRLRLQDPHRYPGRGEPVHHQAGAAQRRRPPDVGHHEHGAFRCSLGSFRDGPLQLGRRRAAGRRGAARGSTRRCRPGRAAGSRPRPATPSPRPEAAAATEATACAAQPRLAHHATRAHLALAHLELRLDQEHEIGLRGRAPDQRGQDQGQGDEGEVGGDQIRCRGHLLRAEARAR